MSSEKRKKELRESIEKLSNQLEQARLDGDKKKQKFITDIINCLKARLDKF